MQLKSDTLMLPSFACGLSWWIYSIAAQFCSRCGHLSNSDALLPYFLKLLAHNT